MSVGIGIGKKSEPELESEIAPVPLNPPTSVTAAHVKTVPAHDMLNPTWFTLPAPPTGLNWPTMLKCWDRFDVVRITGLS